MMDVSHISVQEFAMPFYSMINGVCAEDGVRAAYARNMCLR